MICSMYRTVAQELVLQLGVHVHYDVSPGPIRAVAVPDG